MDQRARRVRQIIADAALGKGEPGVVPLRLGHPVAPRPRRRLARWRLALASCTLLALPLLLPQHGGTAPATPGAAAGPSAPVVPGPGIWKFSLAQADSEQRALGARIGGGGAGPDRRGRASGSGSGDLPVY